MRLFGVSNSFRVTSDYMAIRLNADWMVLADERILEFLEAEGRASPSMIADDDRIPFVRQYINRRLSKLTDSGLTQKVGRGFYQITTTGEEYLSGETDLRDLPEPSA
jgi:predicted transcriptional regulator